jgi:hypothetical protein
VRCVVVGNVVTEVFHWRIDNRKSIDDKMKPRTFERFARGIGLVLKDANVNRKLRIIVRSMLPEPAAMTSKAVFCGQ